LANQKAVHGRDLAGERYLGRTDCEFAERMMRNLESENVALSRPYRADRDDWLLSMARAGLGFCYVPELSVSVEGLVLRPLEPEVRRTVSLVTVRGRPHSPVVGAFLRLAARSKWS
jgi:DNA-binding transcriptional LysR family regulator